jgi:hypothetical protein
LGDDGADGESEEGDSRPETESLWRTRGDEHEAEYEATARSVRHMEGLGRLRLCCLCRFELSRCWAVIPSRLHASDIEEDCCRGDGHAAVEDWCSMSSSETILADGRTISPFSPDPSSDVDDAGLFQH